MNVERGVSERASAVESWIDSKLLRSVCGNFLTGVTIVTTVAGGKQIGRTVNSFTSVSLDPPLVLVCLHRESKLLAGILEHKFFTVNFLAENQRSVSRSFVSGSSQPFANVAVRPGHRGVPVLVESMAYLTCELYQQFQGGDHLVVVGEVIELDVLKGTSEPLTFFRGGHDVIRLGSEWEVELC